MSYRSLQREEGGVHPSRRVASATGVVSFPCSRINQSAANFAATVNQIITPGTGIMHECKVRRYQGIIAEVGNGAKCFRRCGGGNNFVVIGRIKPQW